ncbi:two-component system LytT family sensor kinase [Haloactinospora alba]|uniref:Two-component system LytT family sensor kinase n=1 Tax=Haloactinospora alba TaxID=405555 RepID=A0A543NNH6_9ACTN|nr:histidine kinase [Haloactinospora alba]TQN33347.1 two-component system LytT family sensor kinase [Haloactinospora alba]
MPVRTDGAPRPGRGRAARAGSGQQKALVTARRIVEDMQDGTVGSASKRALASVRRLLGARGVAVSDLSGSLRWVGRPAPEQETGPLVAGVLSAERPRGKPPLVAVPLRVRDELDGVLLVSGDVATGAVREVASLMTQALERGRLERSAERAERAELRALRAEISPHFVYNALTVIASLVHSEPDRARDLMIDFADYARYSFVQHGEYTTVSEEFHAIETYFALQRAVLGDRLQAHVRVAPEVLAVAVPCLVLEPLVENAIRHGIEPRSGPGTVHVHGEADGDECVITVEDDGIGMAPEEARAALSGDADTGRIGLANVDKRLRNVFGSWFGLVLETELGAGTRATVRLPRFQPGVLP